MYKVCQQCNMVFRTYKTKQIFCSDFCRRTFDSENKAPSREEKAFDKMETRNFRKKRV